MKIALLAVTLCLAAAAQTPGDPPPIIKVIRKPGTDPNAARPYADARAAVDVVGMTSVTGLPETWLIEAHYTYASIEDLDKALSALGDSRTPADSGSQPQEDLQAAPRTLMAVLRPAWSYRPDQAMRVLPRARYVHVSIFRIRPGTEGDFGELVKLRGLSADSINLDRPVLAYEVVSGAAAGTYLFLSPLATLRSMDEGVANTPVYAESLVEARAKAGAKAAAAELSREHLLFRVAPRISYVSDAFAAADPEFWRGKPKEQ
ncbi:MAG: hypothetical protein LAP87_15790 [Acidobacteriia bacterium]|nr:hypothetical protein [Terriglobia bacterium]